MIDVCRKKNEKGQSLIELLVALGIGVIIISSLVSLGNASTRRATGSRQENEASKLSQEGLEIMRHIRDSALPGAVRIGPCGNCNWNDLYGISFSGSATSYRVAFNAGGGCPAFEWC